MYNGDRSHFVPSRFLHVNAGNLLQHITDVNTSADHMLTGGKPYIASADRCEFIDCLARREYARDKTIFSHAHKRISFAISKYIVIRYARNIIKNIYIYVEV